MTKKAEKDQVIKVGVTRAAQLYDRDVSTITRWCQNQTIIARQQFSGAPWEIFIPEKEYRERKLILDLRRKSMQTT